MTEDLEMGVVVDVESVVWRDNRKIINNTSYMYKTSNHVNFLTLYTHFPPIICPDSFNNNFLKT